MLDYQMNISCDLSYEPIGPPYTLVVEGHVKQQKMEKNIGGDERRRRMRVDERKITREKPVKTAKMYLTPYDSKKAFFFLFPFFGCRFFVNSFFVFVPCPPPHPPLSYHF